MISETLYTMTARLRGTALALVLLVPFFLFAGAACNPAPVTEGPCKELADAEGGGFEIRLQTVSQQGRELSLTRRVITSQDLTAGYQIETEVTADGQLVMSVQTLGDQTGVEVNVEYGPLVPGVASASASLDVGDGFVRGWVDGRAIVPMLPDEADPSAALFEDGDAAPDLGMDPDLEEALIELLEAAATAAEECPGMNGNGGEQTARIAKVQDHGHDSDPEGDPECLLCWVGCSAAFGTCAGVSAGACAAAGPFYALCFVPAMITCGTAYGVCQHCCYNCGEEPPCCPVECGEVACCDNGETCLNAQIGLCCYAGTTPCAGESCCGSTEVCIDSGPNAGICCEPEDICGNTCCEPLDNCVAELNLCCPFNTQVCGNECCSTGEGCIGGTCCPAERLCGSVVKVCCGPNAGCNSQTNTCVDCPAGERFCTESGGGCCPTNTVCTPVVGICCQPGEIYCDGACKPLGQCIQ